jgi:peptidoglycan/xylan/chitin deacetylase (PgdA/CDA1 family)
MIMGKPKLNFQCSFDDGHDLDHRLADLLLEYQITGTFYIPGGGETPINKKLVQRLLSDGFTIGGHTCTHPMDMKLLTEDEIDWQVGSNKKLLELEGAKVTKFCYPRGRYDDRVIESLKKYGFKSARTTKVLSIDKNQDPYRQATTIHIYPRDEYEGKDWLFVARQYMEKASNEDGVFHLWGHSWEIDKLGQWYKLTELFERMWEKYEVWNI